MKKRIWHLLSNPWNSAVTEYSLSCLQALKIKGWSPVYTPLLGSPAEKRANDLKVTTLPITNFLPLSWIKLFAYYKKIKPDYIFVYEGKETAFTKLFKQKKIIRFRGANRDLNINLNTPYYKLTQNHISGIITPCESIDNHFKESQIAHKKIHLGINNNKFRLIHDIKKNQALNLHIIGRLDPIKGHQKFLKIYASLLKKWTHPKKLFLNILGQEENLTAKTIREWAQEHNLTLGSDFQIVPYRIDNIQNIMSQSDLVVIPSLGSEVICRVAQESLMCGTKVFVSGVGALEETLRNPMFGESYKNLNENDTTALLKKILEQTIEESEQTREKRAELAQELFSLEKMGESLNSFLLSL